MKFTQSNNAGSYGFTIAFIVPVVIYLALAFYIKKPENILTRMGQWSEQDYRPQKSEPVIHVQANGIQDLNPDVLVLGDSFSRWNYWQSILSERTGLKHQSYHFSDVGCVENWIEWLIANASPSLKIVMIERIEEGYLETFLYNFTCTIGEIEPKMFKIEDHQTSPQKKALAPAFDSDYLYLTALNTLSLSLNPEGSFYNGKVYNQPLKRHDLFSNRRSDRLLSIFLDAVKNGEDWNSEQFNQASQNILNMKTRLASQGIELIIIVVPDKTSVYEDFIATTPVVSSKVHAITVSLHTYGILTIDLLTYFKQVRDEIIDLYNPNDLHLSIAGYIEMAHQIEKSPVIQQIKKQALK